MLGIAWDSDDGGGTFRHARSGTFEILYAGHFVYLKGMEYGLEAVARLLDEHPHIRLTMLGEGPSFTRWLKKSQSLGLDANVRWIKSMPRDEFLRRLPFYDALLFPSLHDSGGMVVLEAMAAGLPVVCLDLGGPGVLVDETCGFKVTAADPAATVAGLHKALQQLVADESLGVRLGNAGRRRAHEVFSWKGRVARMLRCYKEVLGK